MARILVVDDDLANREMIRLALKKAGHDVVAAADLDSAREALAKSVPELVVSDLWLGGETGIDLLGEIRLLENPPPVILVTARGTIETAALAARIGAFDYLAKPFDVAELEARVAAALAPPPPFVAGEAPEGLVESLLVGAHPSMVELYKAVARVARLRIPVLLLGETGTGKELIARALHMLGETPGGPFVPVNCGAIPEGLLESELFGHAKGAFTDARRDHQGALARSDGGTAFLDEIGEVSPAFQVKLLRFLEDGRVLPVGGERGETVRVRVVAATNRDLRGMVEAGRFRSDLYYRLAGYEIRLPPLRERRSDIPLLVEHFRLRAARDGGLRSSSPAAPGVLAVLERHDWPGNVRELELVIRRMLVDGGGLSDPAVAERVLDGLRGKSEPGPAASEPGEGTLEDVERRHVLAVLEAAGGNRSEAARRLGIERKTLRRKLERYGVAIAADRGEDEEES